LTAAFVASETPARPNDIGIDIGRLLGKRQGTVQRITADRVDGPYYAFGISHTSYNSFTAGIRFTF